MSPLMNILLIHFAAQLTQDELPLLKVESPIIYIATMKRFTATNELLRGVRVAGTNAPAPKQAMDAADTGDFS